MDCVVCQKPAGNKCSACKNVSYCSVECQKKDWKAHKKSCRPYAIEKNDDGTEYFEATRDLPVGTIIFDETPIFQIPANVEMVNCCLSCSLPIRSGAKYQNCSKCTWPICSLDCEQLPIHRDNECEFLSSNKIKYVQQMKGNAWILIGSRGLMIKRNNKELWKYFQRLGIDNMKPSFVGGYDTIVSHQMSAFKGRTNVEKEVLKEAIELGRNLETLLMNSGFPRLLIQYSGRTSDPDTENLLNIESNIPRERGLHLYKNALKMTKSCSPNTSWHIGDYPDFKIRIRATVPIKKGEKLTLSRLNVGGIEFWGTVPRSHFLRLIHGFFCKCPRCSSPSEFGTYLTAIRCDSCFLEPKDQKKKRNSKEGDKKTVEDVNSGYLLPIDPLAYEYDGPAYLWKCNRCQKTTPYSKFLIKMMEISEEANNVCDQKNFSPDSAKEFIKKYEGSFLHPNHYFLHQVHYQMIGYYSHQIAELAEKSAFFEYQELPDIQDEAQRLAQMEDGISRCDLLIRVVHKILPGFSQYKVKLLSTRAYFKYASDRPLSIGIEKELYVQEIKRRKEELQQILDFFKDNLPSHRGQEKCDEYNLFQSKFKTLEDLEKIILQS